MKTLAVLIFCLFFASCDKKDTETKQTDGYIVGFDPCSLKNNYATGFAIISMNLKDTLMTYNLPDSIYRFPLENFQNYENTGYFPTDLRFKYKIRVTYAIATESEKISLFCLAYINQSEFINATQVIIKSASKIL
jgi:hypothetical protein